MPNSLREQLQQPFSERVFLGHAAGLAFATYFLVFRPSGNSTLAEDALASLRNFVPVGAVTIRRSVAPGDALRLRFGMATKQRTIDYLIEQSSGAGTVSAKPMFGEFGLYVDGKMIGSVCDDQLFVKPTVSGRAYAEPVPEAPPYPGAKPQLLIEADRWDDADWLGKLLRITAADLPTPKPRKPKRRT